MKLSFLTAWFSLMGFYLFLLWLVPSLPIDQPSIVVINGLNCFMLSVSIFLTPLFVFFPFSGRR